jgi:hypothetical protein
MQRASKVLNSGYIFFILIFPPFFVLNFFVGLDGLKDPNLYTCDM